MAPKLKRISWSCKGGFVSFCVYRQNNWLTKIEKTKRIKI
jgi:hypothetical protein